MFANTDKPARLLAAIESLDVEFVQLLLKADPELVHATLNGEGESALYVLCNLRDLRDQSDYEERQNQIGELLIQAGAEIDARDSYNRTPFHAAMRTTQWDLAKRLLQLGADINAVDSGGNTAMHREMESWQGHTVRWLLDMGADHRIKNDDGKTVADLSEKEQFQHLKIRLSTYQVPPQVDFNQPITKDDLLKQDENGLCPLDHNVTWLRFTDIREQLNEAGEWLSIEAMLAKGRDGMSHLERAVINGAGLPLLTEWAERGEQFPAKALLSNDRTKPSREMEVLINHGFLHSLFTEEQWKGQPIAALQAVHDALPARAQNQLTYFTGLKINLWQHSRQQQREARGMAL